MTKKSDTTIDPLNGSFDEVASVMVKPTGRSDNSGIESPPNDREFLFYAAEDGTSSIKVYVEDENTWVTQAGMAEIFGIDKSGISRHLKNIFDEGELNKKSVVAKYATTGPDGKSYLVEFYNLDAIISVGYRVNSYKATQFRIWATTILKEYMLKGFALDDDRLKQGKQVFGKDYFDELLERIREIRASERRFYQKVTDLYIACSYDYDPNSPTTQLFFAHAQNKLEYAVVGMTAAEIIEQRASHKLPHMGLTTWANQRDGGKILKSDTKIAKNYLTEDEISKLNRLVNMFLDFAEVTAERGNRMSMEDWLNRLDNFLKFNEYEALENYGSITKQIAERTAEAEYAKFRPIQDAEYMSDFDKAVQQIKETGKLPAKTRKKLKKGIRGFDAKLRKAVDE